MPSFQFDIGEQARVGSRFIAHVRDEIQRALFSEKSERKITQQQIAEKLGTSRSVINRQIMGLENMTLRRVAEILWAIGWEPYFGVRRISAGENQYPVPAYYPPSIKASASTTNNNLTFVLRAAA
jgi:hypothetical protein